MMMQSEQLQIAGTERYWRVVARCDPRALWIVDIGDDGTPHYSRQTPGADDFMASGKKLVLLGADGLAVWGAIENLDPVGDLRWRVSMFRRLRGAPLASDLARDATTITREWWKRHYRALPPVPLQTEIDPKKVRRKRDPGRCFRRAGWRVVDDDRRGLVVLEAP